MVICLLQQIRGTGNGDDASMIQGLYRSGQAEDPLPSQGPAALCLRDQGARQDGRFQVVNPNNRQTPDENGMTVTTIRINNTMWILEQDIRFQDMRRVLPGIWTDSSHFSHQFPEILW